MQTSRTLPAFLKSDKTIFAAQFVTGAVVIVAMFILLQYSTQAICCGDYDGYYTSSGAGCFGRDANRSLPPTHLVAVTRSIRQYVDHHSFSLFHSFHVWRSATRGEIASVFCQPRSLSASGCCCSSAFATHCSGDGLARLFAPFSSGSNGKAPPLAIIFM